MYTGCFFDSEQTLHLLKKQVLSFQTYPAIPISQDKWKFGQIYATLYNCECFICCDSFISNDFEPRSNSLTPLNLDPDITVP